MGGVGCESLLLRDLCFEPREHGVEGVGELAELVLAAFQQDPVESDPLAAWRVALVMRVSGASMLPARSHPPSRPNTSRTASAASAFGAKARTRSSRLGPNEPVGFPEGT